MSGGKLHLNTVGTGAVAYYSLPGAYDASRDFELELRALVHQVTGPFGFDVEVSDNNFDYEFGVMETGVFLPPPGRPFFALGTAAGESHTYRVTAQAGSFAYQLFLDGVLVKTDTITAGGDPGMRLLFGDGTGGADSHVEIDEIRLCQAPRQFAAVVDVKPGSFPNRINLRSRGRVAVAILSGDTFAAATVDPATVMFAGASAASHGNETIAASLEDVNGDGLSDLVLHFRTGDLQLGANDTVGVLTGRLYDGTLLIGQDSVEVIP